MTEFIPLFLLGLAAGSFLNVLALRYDPDRFLFRKESIGGRSRCPHCGKTLRWFELIPVASFLIQRGRCRSCRARISFQYPLVEILAGLIFALVPLRVSALFAFLPFHFFLSAVWILAFLSLLLMALIDVRFQIIPDEISIFLAALGAAAAYATPEFGAVGGSLIGQYGILLFASASVWINKLLGFLAGGAAIGALYLLTRGKGMGMGDVKLAAALGVLAGWPDIAVLAGIAFVAGACAGIARLAASRATLRSAIPFGPFLALAAAILFFGGFELVEWYILAFAA